MERLLRRLRALNAIAANTFREAIRNKIFGALLVVATGILASSLVLGALSLGQEVRIAADVTLFTSTLFSVLIGLYVSINLLYTEIDRKTIHTLLSKPVKRSQFLLGKFLGVCALTAGIVLLLYGLSSALRLFVGGDVTLSYTWAFAAIYFQVVIVTAVALLFASFSSPLLSGLLTFGTFVLGHLHDQLGEIADYFDAAHLDYIVDGLQFVLPDLAAMNLASEVVHGVAIPTEYFVSAAWYTVSYTAVVLAGAVLTFEFRDLS